MKREVNSQSAKLRKYVFTLPPMASGQGIPTANWVFLQNDNFQLSERSLHVSCCKSKSYQPFWIIFEPTWSCDSPLQNARSLVTMLSPEKTCRRLGADHSVLSHKLHAICDTKPVNHWKIKENVHLPRFFRLFPGDILITQLYRAARTVSRILSPCEPPCRSLPLLRGWPRASYQGWLVFAILKGLTPVGRI